MCAMKGVNPRGSLGEAGISLEHVWYAGRIVRELWRVAIPIAGGACEQLELFTGPYFCGNSSMRLACAAL